MSQQNPATPNAGEDAPDPTGGVGEHMPETPDDDDVDHLEGEFGQLNKLHEAAAGDPTTSDLPRDASTDAGGT